MNTKKHNSANIAELYSRYGILLILFIVFVFGAIITPRFFSTDNLMSVAQQVAVVAVLSCGMTFILISGQADLSAGSAVAMLSVICAVIMRDVGNPVVAFVITIICGMVAYAISGFFVAYIGLPPFIVTLAMLMILRGAAFLLSGGAPILGIGSMAVLATGKIFNIIPMLLIMAMIVMLITWYVLSSTVFGRYVFAIGGNREAAAASGINVKLMSFLVYIVSGAITGLAGILYAARTNSGLPAGAVGYEFDAIIACVLGGVSMSGGVGAIVASVCGAFVVGIINNVQNLFGVNAYYQQIVKGIVILIAIFIDKRTRVAIMRS